MSKNKTSISKATTYKEIGEYWNTHDLGEVWEKIRPVDFEIDIRSQCRYYAVEVGLSGKLIEIAKKQGISLWFVAHTPLQTNGNISCDLTIMSTLTGQSMPLLRLHRLVLPVGTIKPALSTG